MLQGLGHVQHAQLDVTGTHHAFFHFGTSCIYRCCLKTGWLFRGAALNREVAQRIQPAGQHLPGSVRSGRGMAAAHWLAAIFTVQHAHFAQAAAAATSANRQTTPPSSLHGMQHRMITWALKADTTALLVNLENTVHP
ncbi:hypothetical protein D3C78_1302570 [compost metagenome]